MYFVKCPSIWIGQMLSFLPTDFSVVVKAVSFPPKHRERAPAGKSLKWWWESLRKPCRKPSWEHPLIYRPGSSSAQTPNPSLGRVFPVHPLTASVYITFPCEFPIPQGSTHNLLLFWSSPQVTVLVTQPCPTLWDPMDCSLPGPFVHGILQARILEWVGIPFSRGSSLPRDWTWVPCMVGRFFTVWATRETLPCLAHTWIYHCWANVFSLRFFSSARQVSGSRTTLRS